MLSSWDPKKDESLVNAYVGPCCVLSAMYDLQLAHMMQFCSSFHLKVITLTLLEMVLMTIIVTLQDDS